MEDQQSLLSEGETAVIGAALTATHGLPANTPKDITEEDGDQPPMPPAWVDDGEVKH